MSYAAIAARALDTITRKGAAVTFEVRPGEPVYDQGTGRTTESDPVTVTGRAVQIPGDPDRFVALGLQLTDPVTLLVAAKDLGAEPKPGMRMVWATGAYTVRDVDPVAPDGTPIVYTITGSH